MPHQSFTGFGLLPVRHADPLPTDEDAVSRYELGAAVGINTNSEVPSVWFCVTIGGWG